MIYSHLLTTLFPATRRVLGEGQESLDDEAVESILSTVFPNSHPDDVENLMGAFQSFVRQAAPIAQRALPGMAHGALQGAVAGGPVGALIGAVAGGASSALSGPGPTARSAPPQARQASGPVTVQPPQAPAPSPVAQPQGSEPAGPANPDLIQLLTLLSQPQTIQALLQLAMRAQAPVPVGPHQVPAPAFANAIAELAGRVADSFAETPSQGVAPYLVDSHGSPRCDAFNPYERASLLVADLADAAHAPDAESSDTADEAEEVTPEFQPSFDDAADILEAYEAALTGEVYQ